MDFEIRQITASKKHCLGNKIKSKKWTNNGWNIIPRLEISQILLNVNHMTMRKTELLTCMIDRFLILWKDQNNISNVDFQKSKKSFESLIVFHLWNEICTLNSFWARENCCFEVRSPNLGKSTSDFQKSTSDF